MRGVAGRVDVSPGWESPGREPTHLLHQHRALPVEAEHASPDQTHSRHTGHVRPSTNDHYTVSGNTPIKHKFMLERKKEEINKIDEIIKVSCLLRTWSSWLTYSIYTGHLRPSANDHYTVWIHTNQTNAWKKKKKRYKIEEIIESIMFGMLNVEDRTWSPWPHFFQIHKPHQGIDKWLLYGKWKCTLCIKTLHIQLLERFKVNVWPFATQPPIICWAWNFI